MKKILIFGAGKIGRSFIAQLFSSGGYEIIFVDIDPKLVALLNLRKEYKVMIKGDRDYAIQVKNVRAIHFSQTYKIINEISSLSLVATSVGQNGLIQVCPILAKGLIKRMENPFPQPLDIIIAENIRNADTLFNTEIKKSLHHDFPFDEMVGLVETSIGKMVPIMSQKDLDQDPLQIFAESYSTLIVAKNGFKNPIPTINSIDPKDNIKAWVDRKLFIHNLGHATAAYLGYKKNPKWIYIYETLDDDEIFLRTRKTMLQSADILMALYPGEFTSMQLEKHIDELLFRFKNKALGDTIFRVGCDLFRKLSSEDRLAGPVHAAINIGKPFDKILSVIEAAISFRAVNENGEFHPADEVFFQKVKKGKKHILYKISKINFVK